MRRKPPSTLCLAEILKLVALEIHSHNSGTRKIRCCAGSRAQSFFGGARARVLYAAFILTRRLTRRRFPSNGVVFSEEHARKASSSSLQDSGLHGPEWKDPRHDTTHNRCEPRSSIFPLRER